MPKTPDRYPGIRQEDELQLVDNGANPTVEGGMVYKDGAYIFKDGTGDFDPRTGGSAVTFQNLLLTTEGGIIYNAAGAYVIKEVA